MSSLEGVVIAAAFGAGTASTALKANGVMIASAGDVRAALAEARINAGQLTTGRQNRGTTTHMANHEPPHHSSPGATNLRRWDA